MEVLKACLVTLTFSQFEPLFHGVSISVLLVRKTADKYHLNRFHLYAKQFGADW